MGWINKHKRSVQLWIVIVILIMLAYTACCFFIIDKYAASDDADGIPPNTSISVTPSGPPEISVTVEDTELEYILEKTNWEGEKQSLLDEDIIEQMKKDGITVPTVYIGNISEDMQKQSITIDFLENTLPDSIRLYDILVVGRELIKDTSLTEQLIQELDEHQINLPLMHHARVMLGSNSHDYEKSYQRMFRLSCTWGENTCQYIFTVNTSGKTLYSNVNFKGASMEVPRKNYKFTILNIYK